MADPKLLDEIRNNQKPARIPGGKKRPSLRVSLRALPQVRRRQQLNRMLLTNTCGIGEPEPLKFRAADLGLLIQIAEERGTNTNPLLRRQAIGALAQFREFEAVNALARLARSEVEHPSVRISAQMSLQALSPHLTRGTDLAYEPDEARAPGRRKKKKSAPPKDRQ
jgi:hypothetical protein